MGRLSYQRETSYFHGNTKNTQKYGHVNLNSVRKWIEEQLWLTFQATDTKTSNSPDKMAVDLDNPMTYFLFQGKVQRDKIEGPLWTFNFRVKDSWWKFSYLRHLNKNRKNPNTRCYLKSEGMENRRWFLRICIHLYSTEDHFNHHVLVSSFYLKFHLFIYVH